MILIDREKEHTLNVEEKFLTLCSNTTLIIRPPRVSTTETLSVYTTKPKLNIIFKEFMSHVEHDIKHGFTVFIQLEVCPFAVQQYSCYQIPEKSATLQCYLRDL